MKFQLSKLNQVQLHNTSLNLFRYLYEIILIVVHILCRQLLIKQTSMSGVDKCQCHVSIVLTKIVQTPVSTLSIFDEKYHRYQIISRVISNKKELLLKINIFMTLF